MDDPSTLESELAFAHKLADTARRISLTRFRGRFTRRTKPDGSLVTEVDEAVEDALREQIRTGRPDDAVLGEERGETGQGSRRWIIDAIDGTHVFAAGCPEWATLIALECDGLIVVGVCDEPALDRRYAAALGLGAYLTVTGSPPRRLAVSAVSELAAARSFVPPAHWVPDERARDIADAFAAATAPLSPGAHPALEIARGDRDLAIFFVAGPWDLAAPSLIVEEAGGCFTDMAGHRSISSGTAVFSNGHLHGATLELTR